MSEAEAGSDLSRTERFLPSGEEAGTAPEDRAFRPDVEGLRAVAIILVVLYHCGVPHMGGGFVGVDVFFVVSGFVITGVLLRERRSAGRISFLTFYARRARRILPAAILVILVSLVASFLFVGAKYATLVASDSRWTALFLGDFHFMAAYPNYLVPRPTSSLQQYWTLAVEEQFYLVYPAFFVVIFVIARPWSSRARLAIGLSVVIAISLPSLPPGLCLPLLLPIRELSWRFRLSALHSSLRGELPLPHGERRSSCVRFHFGGSGVGPTLGTSGTGRSS